MRAEATGIMRGVTLTSARARVNRPEDRLLLLHKNVVG
jgi:hypothetical protein